VLGPSPTMTVRGNAVLALRLASDDFADSAVCLGPQVADVLAVLHSLSELIGCQWHAAYVDPMGAPEQVISALRHYEATDGTPIQDIQAFIGLSRQVTQFLDGIIYAVPGGETPRRANKADASMLFAVNGVVQMDAHDTTLIEIMTERRSIVDGVQRRFGGKLHVV
jgi:hypothetical protein